MNAYAPPGASLKAETTRVPLWVRLLAFPLLALGALVTSALAYWALGFMPEPSTIRAVSAAVLLGYSALSVIAAAAPWWFPVARIYGRRAVTVGAGIALAPLAVRLALSPELPRTVFMAGVTLIETIGLVAAFALGSRLLARRLGANNSSKPTPLRGAA